MRRHRIRGAPTLVLALALVAGVVATACEPVEDAPFRITVDTTIETWEFDGVTQGAPRGTPATASTTFPVSQDEWDQSDNPYGTATGWDDPEWGDRDEGAVSLQARTIIHGGSASPAGCRAYTQWVHAKTWPMNATIYRYKQRYTWCWYLTVVYNLTFHRDLVDIDSAWSYEGIASSYNEFYPWNGGYGHGRSGYRWYRKLHFYGGCIPIVGNCANRYPWMKMWVHSNGTFSINDSDDFDG